MNEQEQQAIVAEIQERWKPRITLPDKYMDDDIELPDVDAGANYQEYVPKSQYDALREAADRYYLAIQGYHDGHCRTPRSAVTVELSEAGLALAILLDGDSNTDTRTDWEWQDSRVLGVLKLEDKARELEGRLEVAERLLVPHIQRLQDSLQKVTAERDALKAQLAVIEQKKQEDHDTALLALERFGEATDRFAEAVRTRKARR